MVSLLGLEIIRNARTPLQGVFIFSSGSFLYRGTDSIVGMQSTALLFQC